MVNEFLVNLVNPILGEGTRTARGNIAYYCPFCSHHKKKLEINFTENKEGAHYWHCWFCNSRGRTLYSLFKKLDVPYETLIELKSLIKNRDYIEEKEEKNFILTLPKEFKSILNNKELPARRAFTYLKRRGIQVEDILKYNIGYCEEGIYANRIIVPSYDESNKLNYFTCRSFEEEPYRKYTNPPVSRDIIPFELFINWDIPIILCEGVFDALAIKRNVIPLLGKNIQSSLMKKIVTSRVQKIYLALDSDAQKLALNHAQYLMDQGKEVYLVELDGKDPSEIGFGHFTELIQNTYPLTQYDLMEKKLQLI